MSINLKKMAKHLHISEFAKTDDCNLVRHHKPTLRHEIIGDSILINEQSDEKSPFLYTDFSLKSIIESGNLNLLNPVGNILDSNLVANDKVISNSDKIDNFINNYITE